MFFNYASFIDKNLFIIGDQVLYESPQILEGCQIPMAKHSPLR